LNISNEVRDELVRLTRDLVSIRSVNPPGSEAEIAGYVENYLEDLGLATTSVDLNGDPDRRSVVGRIPGKGSGSIVLCGHLDTVDVTEEHWTVPAFDGLVKDDRIYGRGSADMKGGLAVMMVLARLIVESGMTPDRDVVLAFTADEEKGYGGAYNLGSGDLLDDSEFLIITEPTNGNVYAGEKGELWAEVTFHGKAAHGSTPENGVNAVMIAAEFALNLASRVDKFPRDDSIGRTTLNVGQLDGGWQVNIVPDKATVKLDFRVITDDHRELALEAVNELAEKLAGEAGGEYEAEVMSYQKPVVSDVEDHFVSGFYRAAGSKPGGDDGTGPIIVPYCTDASALVPQLEVPLVLYGPGAIEMAHQPDEYVEIDSLIESLETFVEFFGVAR